MATLKLDQELETALASVINTAVAANADIATEISAALPAGATDTPTVAVRAFLVDDEPAEDDESLALPLVEVAAVDLVPMVSGCPLYQGQIAVRPTTHSMYDRKRQVLAEILGTVREALTADAVDPLLPGNVSCAGLEVAQVQADQDGNLQEDTLLYDVWLAAVAATTTGA